METVSVTNNLLLELRLHGLREAISARLKQAKDESLGYEIFLNLLLQDELDHRKAERIKRLLKQALFRQQASLEGFDFATPRGLDKKRINDFAACRYIQEGTNVIISGPTGVGKTFLSTALGNTACRRGFSTIFYRMNTLIEQSTLARAKGTYLNLVKRISTHDLLILDDFGIKPLTPQQFQDFYDILDERGDTKSTVITTQIPIANWGEVISDPVTCEAITDRLAAHAYNIQMKGDSYRKKNRRNQGST